jgi:hypothetical protein
VTQAAAPEAAAAPAAVEAVQPADKPTARGGENLEVMYAHVRRDLRRILVLAIIMFALIIISPYVL